jgi:hypothetical protein
MPYLMMSRCESKSTGSVVGGILAAAFFSQTFSE